MIPLEREIDILFLNFVKSNIKSAFNQLRIRGTSNISKCRITFIRRDSLIRSQLIQRLPLHISHLSLKGPYLMLTTILNSNAKYSRSQIRMDSRFITLHPFRIHLHRSFHNPISLPCEHLRGTNS